MITVAHVVTNRASYGRVKSILDILHQDKDFELKLIVSGAGNVVDIPYPITQNINPLINGDEKKDMATSTGLLMVQLPILLENIQPDVVLIHGDRYEQMAIATVCSYMGIPIAHTEGGEITGCIDDKVRNAISMMADYHFPVTYKAEKRLNKICYDRKYLKSVGSPALDIVRQSDLSNDRKEPYILVMFHPNTTENESINEVLEALRNIAEYKKVLVNCNVDAGSMKYLKSMHATGWEFVKDLSPEEYYRLLANCEIAVGNSSSFIKEGAFLGVKALLIGDRQNSREHANNVMYADCERIEIEMKVRNFIAQPYLIKDTKFGRGNSATKIVEALRGQFK